MFEIGSILDEAGWELAACQISTIISLLGSKQMRLGVPKVPGPLCLGGVDLSECVTSLMEIHFNQKRIRDPSGHVHSSISCLQGLTNVASLYLKLWNVQVTINQLLTWSG